ncbi:ribonuclease Z, mitochondrial isoform X2 [Zerene cesonia]|uniref:ribonuclease Z, mitochondrial isoform X2 n=1 Tax=Zerene cesonia TaxID=33412 RepID=UPI0018E58F8E|nr:ribonuclease Z, mitochondrial isoform X2 [Zerene cesonia]
MNGKLSLFRKVVRCNLYKYFYSNNSHNRLLDLLANMSKSNPTKTAEVQRQRLKLTKKGEKYGPSTIYLQVLGSGARGAPNTLYLFTDQKRYLFNCGECSQRLAHEHKVKLSRLDHIFITSKTWKNVGGLPGLSLTLQDVGVPNITLHGPEGLDELYNATKRFVIMKDLNVTMAKCSPSEDFEDNVMSVKYVLLGPQDNLLSSEMKPAAKKPKLDSPKVEAIDQEFEEFIHDDTDYYRSKSDHKNADNSKNRNLKHKTRSTFEKEAMKKKAEKVMHNLNKLGTTNTVAYICTLKKRLGTLDLEKCVELGVKPGPLLGQLKSGQDVVLPDGRLVLSKDVKTPDDPGPVFIVLEVPDISYLKEDEFAAHFDDGSNPQENIPAVVVHYTPPHVFNHPVYQSFMALFGPTTRHLILNSMNSCLGSEAVHRTQHKLHLLDPDIFPLLKDLSVPAVWNAHPPLPKTSSPIRLKGLEELKNKFQTIINMDAPAHGDGAPAPDAGRLELLAARTLTVFHLRPKRQLDRSAEPKLHIQDYIQETMDVDGFVPSLEQFRRLVDTMRYAKTDAKEYPKVVFLGTGSCIPSKTRNTSAIVLQIDEQRSMLLDCGEGTFGQLVRFYGPKRVNAFLRTLKAIYISHLHADHHIGLIGVLQARREALDEVSDSEAESLAQPLYLLAPGQIVTWLSKYDQQFESIRGEFTLIPNQNLTETKQSSQGEMTSAALASLGVERLATCHVAHCPNAFGVAVCLPDAHKITYSGDTIPCDELVKIGQNSTLLIHEATMEDELADEARVKMHSTTSQAIEVGRAMAARYTLLTHFSQRYARLPRLNAHILNDNKSVGIAFDNMQITMSDLDLLPHMYAPLQLMFAEHCVELELKAAHRARVKERQPSSPALPTSGTIRQYSTDHRQDGTDDKHNDHRQDDSQSQATDHRRDSNNERCEVDGRREVNLDPTDHRQTLDGHIQDMVIDNRDNIVSGS